MTYYIGVVDAGPDGFGIWFPDLPGCTSGGATMDALFRGGIEAVALWAEDVAADGEPLPVARRLDQLRDDPAVRETLAAGETTFLQVPLLREAGRPVRANLSLDAGLLDAIDAAAAQAGLTRSGFLASAARDKIKRL